MANRQDLVICDNAHLSPADCFHYCKPLTALSAEGTDAKQSDAIADLFKGPEAEAYRDGYRAGKQSAGGELTAARAERDEAREQMKRFAELHEDHARQLVDRAEAAEAALAGAYEECAVIAERADFTRNENNDWHPPTKWDIATLIRQRAGNRG